ncbi:MAG TPA: GNAT family N-acetyltransferase [Solirubrobacteraceae bacterium]|nr:GNAT family N-acetyltransferase [Solirubrobacteraceae bacterium]
MTARELVRADWPTVLALNEASVRELSPLDETRLQYILELAYAAFVVEREGAVAAFAIAIAPGTPYDSANYRWFAERYERFLYLDRIAVGVAHRRHGLGALLYDAMEEAARPFGQMVCDVNVRPRNDASLGFHAARGYEDIGRLDHGQVKTVALMRKQL